MRVTNVTVGGGGPTNKMLHLLKLCLKSISVFDISWGQQKLFLKKCLNNGLVSKENTLFFCYSRGGGQAGVQHLLHFYFFN